MSWGEPRGPSTTDIRRRALRALCDSAAIVMCEAIERFCAEPTDENGEQLAAAAAGYRAAKADL